MTGSNKPAIRTQDLIRHLNDLRTGTFEGVAERHDKETVYRKGVELIDAVARSVMQAANEAFLEGTGEITLVGPEDDGEGGLVARFELSWPEQRARYVTRGESAPLQPARIVVWYHTGFLHPHLGGTAIGYWPFQVLTPEDAERQRPVLAAILEAELHQRIYETDWTILPVSRTLGQG